MNELANLPEAYRQVIVDHQRQLLDVADRLVLARRPDLARSHAERRAIVMLSSAC